MEEKNTLYCGLVTENEILLAAQNDKDKQTKYDNAYDRKKGFIEGAKWAIRHIREDDKQRVKLYRVEFEGLYPAGNCLVLLAYSQQEAEIIAGKTIRHTSEFVVNEIAMNEPKIIEYLSGDY
jgi:hypothetical protein